jgi:nitrite reductase (NADH) small subunit
MEATASGPRTAPQEIFVADSGALNNGERKIVNLGSTEAGVYRLNGKLYAYQNLCAHQGGPACEGLMMPKVEQVLGSDKSFERNGFNYDEWHIVCPWHAWEYKLTTGEYVVNPKFRLKKFEVVEKDGKIFILI